MFWFLFFCFFVFCTREFAGSFADSGFSRFTSQSAANSVSMETVEGRRGGGGGGDDGREEEEAVGCGGGNDVDFLTHSGTPTVSKSARPC